MKLYFSDCWQRLSHVGRAKWGISDEGKKRLVEKLIVLDLIYLSETKCQVSIPFREEGGEWCSCLSYKRLLIPITRNGSNPDVADIDGDGVPDEHDGMLFPSPSWDLSSLSVSLFLLRFSYLFSFLTFFSFFRSPSLSNLMICLFILFSTLTVSLHLLRQTWNTGAKVYLKKKVFLIVLSFSMKNRERCILFIKYRLRVCMLYPAYRCQPKHNYNLLFNSWVAAKDSSCDRSDSITRRIDESHQE